MKHLDVVAAVVEIDNKYLCMQRGVAKYPYTSFKFEFPGGKIEQGESPEEALRRELKEELAYPITVEKSLVTVDYRYPDFSITMQAFLCTAPSTNFIMKEHYSYRWLAIDELTQLDWAAADVLVVKRLISLSTQDN
jgi:8-oxo-dGTP diphosphatase